MKTNEVPKTKSPWFTSRTRRGLADALALLHASFDSTKPPSETIVARWGKTRIREFNLAMSWIEAKTSDLPERDLYAKR